MCWDRYVVKPRSGYWPAAIQQNILRHRTLGDMAWRRLSEGRLKDKERETNIYEILGRMRVSPTSPTHHRCPPSRRRRRRRRRPHVARACKAAQGDDTDMPNRLKLVDE